MLAYLATTRRKRTLFPWPGQDLEKLALSWQPRWTFMPHASQQKPWFLIYRPNATEKARKGRTRL